MAWKAFVVLFCAAQSAEPCPECSVRFSNLVHNNLGGIGPDGGPQQMRFGRVCNVQGQDVDLVLMTISPYRGRSQIGTGPANGLYGGTGLITVGRGSQVTVRFAFVRSGTDQFTRVGSFVITILDVDSNRSGYESVLAFSPRADPINDVLAQDSHLTRESVIGGVNYTSSSPYVSEARDPLRLTPEQQRAAVGLFYTNVNFADFTFSAISADGGTDGFFLFQFAGLSSLTPCTSPTPPPSPSPTPQPTVPRPLFWWELWRNLVE